MSHMRFQTIAWMRWMHSECSSRNHYFNGGNGEWIVGQRGGIESTQAQRHDGISHFHLLHHNTIQSDFSFLTEYKFSDDTSIELYNSLHITLHLGLFLWITHPLIFHVPTLTCCSTSNSHHWHHLTSRYQHSTPLTTTRQLPATLSSLKDILSVTEQTAPCQPTSWILHSRSLTIKTVWFPFQKQNLETSAYPSLTSTAYHNHRISTSGSPV